MTLNIDKIDRRVLINIATLAIPAFIVLIFSSIVAVGINLAYQFSQGLNPTIYHKTFLIGWIIYAAMFFFFLVIHIGNRIGKKNKIKRGNIINRLLKYLIWIHIIGAGIFIGPFVFLIIFLRSKSKWDVVGTSFLVASAFFGVILKFKNLPPKGGPYIFVANHSSFWDYLGGTIVVWIAGLEYNIVYGTNLHGIPIVGWLLKRYAIPVNRDDPRSFPPMRDMMVAEIEAGRNVLIYPEAGRITVEEALSMRIRQLRTPAFKVAQKCDVEVVPFVFSWPFLYRAKGGEKLFSPCIVEVTFLSPRKITGDDLTTEAETIRQEMLEVLNSSKAVKDFFNEN